MHTETLFACGGAQSYYPAELKIIHSLVPSRVASATPAVPATLGHYRIAEKIGEAGWERFIAPVTSASTGPRS